MSPQSRCRSDVFHFPTGCQASREHRAIVLPGGSITISILALARRSNTDCRSAMSLSGSLSSPCHRPATAEVIHINQPTARPIALIKCAISYMCSATEATRSNEQSRQERPTFGGLGRSEAARHDARQDQDRTDDGVSFSDNRIRAGGTSGNFPGKAASATIAGHLPC